MLMRFLADDRGQDLIEYALLSGIIAVATALVVPAIADTMKGTYNSWQTAARAAWEPCPPAPAACP